MFSKKLVLPIILGLLFAFPALAATKPATQVVQAPTTPLTVWPYFLHPIKDFAYTQGRFAQLELVLDENAAPIQIDPATSNKNDSAIKSAGASFIKSAGLRVQSIDGKENFLIPLPDFKLEAIPISLSLGPLFSVSSQGLAWTSDAQNVFWYDFKTKQQRNIFSVAKDSPETIDAVRADYRGVRIIVNEKIPEFEPLTTPKAAYLIDLKNDKRHLIINFSQPSTVYCAIIDETKCVASGSHYYAKAIYVPVRKQVQIDFTNLDNEKTFSVKLPQNDKFVEMRIYGETAYVLVNQSTRLTNNPNGKILAINLKNTKTIKTLVKGSGFDSLLEVDAKKLYVQQFATSKPSAGLGPSTFEVVTTFSTANGKKLASSPQPKTDDNVLGATTDRIFSGKLTTEDLAVFGEERSTIDLQTFIKLIGNRILYITKF